MEGYKNKYHLYLKIAGEYNDRSIYDSALLYCDSAVYIAQDIKDQAYAIKATSIRGTTLWRTGETEVSLNELKHARERAYKLDNDTLCAIVDRQLGLAYSISGKRDSALILYENAITYYENAGDSIGKAGVLNLIAILYKEIRQQDRALEYALKAYWMAKNENDPKELTSALINLGNVYELMSEHDSALACYKETFRIGIEQGLIHHAYISLTNAAVIYYRFKQYEKSRDAFLQSILYYEEVGNKRELALLYSNITLVYKALGNYDKALQSANRSIAIADELGLTTKKIYALNNLGITYKAIGDYSRAENCYKQSLQLAMEEGLSGDMLKAYRNLANLSEFEERYKQALDYLWSSDSLQKILYNDRVAEEIAHKRVIYEVRHLKDQTKISRMEKDRMKFERNVTLVIGILCVIILLWIAVYFVMKIRKNRIITLQRIKQLEDEKKILAAQSVIVGQEEERKRIARELHDGIGVLLSTAKIQFSSIEEDETDEKVTETFKKAQKMLDNAGKEVRRISHDMMPGVLSKFGLREAIEDLFDEIRESGNLDVRLTLNCSDERLPENLEIMLYRVVQEMLNNTIKHAQANRIDCTVNRKPRAIEIDYRDDGIGFNEAALPHDKSLGLFGIRSRIDFLSGTVDIDSEKDKGTRFKIFVPLILDIKRG
jgi:signal transduction histidine kinase